jgi:hypothetical protein
MRCSLVLCVCVAGLCGCSSEGQPAPRPWPTCTRLTSPPTLAERAARFDRVAREQHLAGDGLMRSVYLSEDLTQVDHWLHVENNILWSGMYLASQAFRYAVTGEAEAVENARTVLAGLLDLTRVTGVRGLYGRALARPDVPYDHDGHASPSWTESPVAEYAGWWYRNDVSKDGYDGLMFGYAAALEHFDDPALLAEVRERVTEVADHLVGNGLQIIDADGEVTEHGRLYQSAYDDYPGFNALLVASWIKVAAQATGDPALDEFYYACLMRTRPHDACPVIDQVDLGSYADSMEDRLLLFKTDCKQNYDNFDMAYQAIYPLLRREQDETLRSRFLGVLRQNMFHTDEPGCQTIDTIGNSMFTLLYAALTGDGPDDDPLLEQAVDDAVCKLAEFPEEKFDRLVPQGTQPEVCRTRLDEPAAAAPIPLDVYAFDNYLWRLDFFQIQEADHPEDRRLVFSPEDYLVAYWVGRLHGLIGPER